MMTFFAIALTVIILSTAGIAGMNAAYRNGVNDGYGYSREPNNPGYRKAGDYLRKYMLHRWRELRENS